MGANTRRGHDGRMGLADAYMVFVFAPIGIAFMAYHVRGFLHGASGGLSTGEWWGMAGIVAMLLVAAILMAVDPGMRRNMKAAQLRAARRAARKPTMTIEITVH